jgi:hypothetical protein
LSATIEFCTLVTVDATLPKLATPDPAPAVVELFVIVLLRMSVRPSALKTPPPRRSAEFVEIVELTMSVDCVPARFVSL